MYDFDQRVIRTRHFPAVYAQQVAADPQIKLAYAHLSTDPASLLREAILYTYAERGGHDGPVPELGSVGWTRTGRFVLNMAKTGSVGQWLKWSAQKHVLPRFRPCQVQRSDALGESEACWVSRNQALFTSLDVLKNKIPDDTDILQEYFLPPDQLVGFLEHAEAVLAGSDAVLVNASIRAVAADDILLSYAPSDRFAVVLYVNQKTTAAGDAAMAELTGALIDAALERGGAFYLPYQLRYTPEQLAAAYPRAEAFFELKRSWDPDERFTSTFYERYGPSGG
jgi:FAD/FMN-containing dehydrogenase